MPVHAYKADFSMPEHLLCDINMYDNGKKLKALNVQKNVSKTVLCDIFGFIRQETKVPRPVDSLNNGEYDENLTHLTRKW